MNLRIWLTLLALGSTLLQAVSEELPGQQPRNPDDWLYLAFGRGRFEANAKIDVQAQAKERHELRCCSRQHKPGWKRTKTSCPVWHESDKLVGLDGKEQCFHAVTYTEAQAICTKNDAYVCTKEEVESGCAKGSGCQHDADWVWTSNDSPPGQLTKPGQEKIPPDDYMFLACGSGANGKCEEAVGVAKASETHEVRCCSSRLNDAWMVGNNCNNFHESSLTDLDGKSRQCIHAATYAEAQQICELNNAYVCTRDQVLQGCASSQHNGCKHDSDLIWTSNTASPTDVAGFLARQSQASSISGVCTDGFKGKVWGDPHFITFDKLKYDCQGHGEFVIAKSEGTDPLAIHGRFVRRRSAAAKPTVTSSVAIKVHDDVPVIHVSVPDEKVKGKCPFTFTVGNDEAPVPQNDIVNFLKAYNGTANAFEKKGRSVIFTFPEQDARVQITGGGRGRCVLNTNLCLTPDKHGGAQNIVGLLGSPTGKQDDDWMNTDGSNVALPAICDVSNPSRQQARQCKTELNKEGHAWCMDNWCVGDADESLWKPETHALYNQCDDLSPDPFFDYEPSPEVIAACEIAPNPEECETDSVAEIQEGGDLNDFLDTLFEDEKESNFIDNLDIGYAEEALDGWDGPVSDGGSDSPIEIDFPPEFEQEDPADFGSGPPPKVTERPSSEPSQDPSTSPSSVPSSQPSSVPSSQPSEKPSSIPSREPTSGPTSGPTSRPTSGPTSGPTSRPTIGPTSGPTSGPTIAKTNGDPHFKTWKGEHFEYHGQCDMILAKDDKFADGLGLEVHIRTKLVRFWSYIKTASILIGNDVLEIEGSADPDDHETHYWFNFEYQGDATEIGGFPLSIPKGRQKDRKFVIDLSSKYPGQKIIFSTFREFVSVEFRGSTTGSFGNTVGMLGDYSTGRTLARDGVSVIDDFSQLGNEWQVLPADSKLFHEIEEPQFPRHCIEPEDPRGERRRRLQESSISVEEAEAACSKALSDALDIKDCVYDILATQDMDMVGAF